MSVLTERLASERSIKPLRAEIAQIKADVRMLPLQQAVLAAAEALNVEKVKHNHARTAAMKALNEAKSARIRGEITEAALTEAKQVFADIWNTKSAPAVDAAKEVLFHARSALGTVRNEIRSKLLDLNAKLATARSLKPLNPVERLQAMKELGEVKNSAGL